MVLLLDAVFALNIQIILMNIFT